MSKRPKYEQGQLDLRDPKTKSLMEPILSAGSAIQVLVNHVAICCVHQIKSKGGTFADAKKVGRDAFAAYIAEYQNQTNEKWPDFFVDYVKSQNLGISDESLKKLKGKMEAFAIKRKISELIDVRKLCQTLLSNKRTELSKESIEKVRELLYDLSYRHW